MKKIRIIKRITPLRIEYVIQVKHFLFFWWWVDAWINTNSYVQDSFPTLEEAKANLYLFDGTKNEYEVVYKNYKPNKRADY